MRLLGYMMPKRRPPPTSRPDHAFTPGAELAGYPHDEIASVVADADALDYRLSVVPKKPPDAGEQAALDLISRLHAGPPGR
jgi:hypothetical protein